MFMVEAVSTLIASVATLFSVLLLWRRFFPDRSAKTVALVVLGDIGRSPRMMYHAKSFARHGWTTYIVSYKDSKLPSELEFHPHVHFVHVARPFAWSSESGRVVFLACLPLRVILGALSLLIALVYELPFGPTFIFVQNPPALPTLPVVQLAALLRHSRVVIDWHNTGFSILALRLGENHPVCRLARMLELTFGSTAFAHFFVTNALREQVKHATRVRGKKLVLHDRPPAEFRHLTEEEAHDLFFKLPLINNRELLDWAQPDHVPTSKLFERTAFSAKESGSSKAQLVKDRPALVVSATSWTADEDFDILLNALSEYDRLAIQPSTNVSEALPRVVAIITGKGAGKASFETRLAKREKDWQRVQVRTAWLDYADYPKLLGAADLGLSFHTSTSGADLPMKVVDMFGCGLPVCALDFACLSELVQDGVNGKVFKDADGLASALVALLRGFPLKFPSELDMLKAGIHDARYDNAHSDPSTQLAADGDDDDDAQASGEEATKGPQPATWCSWDENWDRVVLPVVTPRRDRML